MYLELAFYERPTTVAAALRLLALSGSAPIAGGTHLNVHGHEHLRSVVDLQALPLGGVAFDADRAWLGALTTLAEVLAADLPAGLAALTEAVTAEKNLAVRNRSTLGGRISRNRADARLATALLALGAEVEVFTAGDGGAVQATVPLAKRLADVASRHATGLVGGIVLPSATRWSAYLTAQFTAVDAPMTDAALAETPSGLALAGGVHADNAGGTVLLPRAAAQAAALTPDADPAAWRSALRATVLDELPSHTDALVSGDYRRDVAATLVVRLVEAWLSRPATAGGAA